MTDDQHPEQQDENKLIAQRREKLASLRQHGNAFPNDFRRDSLAGDLQAQYADWDAERLDAESIQVAVAGRMMAKRVMGKASFSQLQDMSGRIQLFLRSNDLPDGVHEDFKTWDVGDIVGVRGVLTRTKTGELSVKAQELRLLTKALRPLPEKWHGIADQETRYRQRYVDLIVTEEARRTFVLRSRIVQYIREYLNDKGFLEVETPMMQPLPGGASARPFVTHHNALDTKLYLRIAPELYLKRLVVGGFEKVYEINRNFRNEGVSTRHNPEFTMLEFYQAYADHHMMMDHTEELLRGLAQEIVGNEKISYQGETFDFGKPFQRVSVFDAILQHNPDIRRDDLSSVEAARALCERLNIPLRDTDGLGRLQMEVFEKTTEHKLREPTFVIDYPKEVSPLARAKDSDPFLTDRFELVIGGREIANGFSELNDAEDQAERFREQAADKAAGDEEAMYYDADYIRALEYGLPPTAGEGIGIDRLVMLLTDSASIRDVLLFPAMRPETR